MMEGEGVYRWANGARYKGEFQQNQIHGKGLLEWDSVCWYEGDFVNGLRHGRGLLVDGGIRYMYTGHWYRGQKHGKGYCRYGDKSSYDGDWVMNKMNGVGLRIYASGARYVGQWKNGLRHGRGTMVWTNGNVYRGEWKCGAMNGYGKYIWEGFFNQTLTWPQEASYTGYWRDGMRHGKGILKLKSVGGAKYLGYWKDNKKHGHGIIIGSNGEKFEANPLFLNDILVTSDITDGTSVNESENNDRGGCVRVEKETEPQFLEKPDKLGEAPVIPIMRPEHFPSLSYHLTRLLNPKALEPPTIPLVPSGKCNTCEDRTCSCLKLHPLGYSFLFSQKFDTATAVSEETVSEKDIPDSKWESEERSTYDCIIKHMPRLRQIYNDYAKLFTQFPPTCILAMSRLCLWQLWRDCNINRKGLSLVEIDTYIAKNASTLVEDPHNPFEKIEIWQFLHALLEIAWHLYTKYNDMEIGNSNEILASGLLKLLENDIYPHVGNHVGYVWCKYRDLLPINCIFELHKEIGYPCSAKDLLRIMCAAKGTQASSITDETTEPLPDGINSVTIGEKVNYLLKLDKIFTPSHRIVNLPRKYKNNSSPDLSDFGQLGASRLVEIMASICPAIKDTENGVVIYIDYELTFLEFYEIMLEATKQLLLMERKSEKEVHEKAEVDAVLRNENGTSRTTQRLLTQKGPKIKNDVLK
ncbi:uncharacterized protein LOC143180079 [Calliopsis andreniformis]|uniref:uncharacterized protein LOC143180079 n=1 Tax=Calliopsis andreniformis TaxID=337506 RepID=UPI003FCDAAD7